MSGVGLTLVGVAIVGLLVRGDKLISLVSNRLRGRSWCAGLVGRERLLSGARGGAKPAARASGYVRGRGVKGDEMVLHIVVAGAT